MAKVAVFVDAGYLIARGAEALVGPQGRRRDVILDESKTIETLIKFAESKACCPGEILRVYWYDGAASQPTAEQIRLAELDNVKLRLGTINSFGKQKGVDSLIIADMIELAMNHACDSFLVVGGDEDLRVGVQVAQKYGIRVHLLGISILNDKAQSPGLARETDTNNGWTAEDIEPFIKVRPAAAVVTTPIVGGVQPATAQSIVNEAATSTQTAGQIQAPLDKEALESAVKEFYDSLLETDIDDIQTVWATNRSIPQPHDGRLLARTGAALGRPLDIPEKREMRRIFTRLLGDKT